MSKLSQNNPFEQIFKALTAQILAAAKEMAIGTVSSVTTSGIGITIDGDSSGVKKYTCNRAERFSSGDRVLCARESGTWVVICRIGAPGGPVAKTSAMTQAVGTDADGKLYTKPGAGAYELPTASTSQLGGIKTSEAYSSSKHTAKVAVDSGGVLYAEAYSLPTAGASTLGGVKPVAKTSAMTQDVGVDSSGKLYTKPGEGAYELPTASTTVKGGVMTSAAYSATTHTLDVAIDSSGKLHAAAPAASNVSRLYAGTSTTYYAELNSSKVFAPNGTGFNFGSTTYPWQSLYFARSGASTYYLKAEASNIQPATTTSTTSYYNLGSSTYPFYALYVKKLFVNGKEITTNASGAIVASTPDAAEMWDGSTPEEA